MNLRASLSTTKRCTASNRGNPFLTLVNRMILFRYIFLYIYPHPINFSIMQFYIFSSHYFNFKNIFIAKLHAKITTKHVKYAVNIIDRRIKRCSFDTLLNIKERNLSFEELIIPTSKKDIGGEDKRCCVLLSALCASESSYTFHSLSSCSLKHLPKRPVND